MTRMISRDELLYGGIVNKSEGCRYGATNVSFFLVNAPPGSGPRLHTHPHEEVCVAQEGRASFTVGDATSR